MQSTTLEAELVSSGRGEGDPCSVCLPAPSRSLLPFCTAGCRGKAALVRTVGCNPDSSPQYMVPANTVRMWLEESSVKSARGVNDEGRRRRQFVTQFEGLPFRQASERKQCGAKKGVPEVP